jgi:8-oxo-dGTP pyrophosphatase MutT (NUDIX family)
MLVEKPKHVDRIAAGCICTYKGKYLLMRRVKDGLWNSVTGKVEKDEAPPQAIIRELREEIDLLDAKPKPMAKLYHDYGRVIVEYHLFWLELAENPLLALKLNKKEHHEMGLFSLEEALKLRLYEDEDYCLKLHSTWNRR